jgi:hypothetical protein
VLGVLESPNLNFFLCFACVCFSARPVPVSVCFCMHVFFCSTSAGRSSAHVQCIGPVFVPFLGISFHRAGLPSSTRIRHGVSCVIPCESSSTHAPSGHGTQLLSERSFSRPRDLCSDAAGRHRSPVWICFYCQVDSSLAVCFSGKSLWHNWPARQCLLLIWNAFEGAQL